MIALVQGRTSSLGRRLTQLALGWLIVSSVSIAQADAIDIEGLVKAIDPTARSITIERQTPKGTKTLELEVHEGAGDLNALKVGAPIKCIYDPTLELVTAIKGILHRDTAIEQAEVRTLEEIPGTYASLTDDGLQLFYEAVNTFPQGGEIWQAERLGPSEAFIGKKQVLVGRHPTIRGDGLELIHIRKRPDRDEWTLWSAGRKDKSEMLSGDRELPVFRAFTDVKCPFLTSDGLHLYFTAGKPLAVWQSRRRSLEADWQAPTKLDNALFGNREGSYVTWPWVSHDSLAMIVTGEGPAAASRGPRLFRRAKADEQWRDAGPLDSPGLGQRGVRCVRYNAETEELFLTDSGKIRVISHYRPTW